MSEPTWTRRDVVNHDSAGEYCGTDHLVIGPDGYEIGSFEEAADADLAAAAPEMRDAIMFTLAVLNQKVGGGPASAKLGLTEGHRAVALLRNALAKAEGGDHADER